MGVERCIYCNHYMLQSFFGRVPRFLQKKLFERNKITNYCEYTGYRVSSSPFSRNTVERYDRNKAKIRSRKVVSNTSCDLNKSHFAN